MVSRHWGAPGQLNPHHLSSLLLGGGWGKPADFSLGRQGCFQEKFSIPLSRNKADEQPKGQGQAQPTFCSVPGQGPQGSLFSKHPNKHGRPTLRLLCGLSMEQRAALARLQKEDVFLAEFLKKKQPCSVCIPFHCFPSAPRRPLNSLTGSS